jgi:hypothetical protein
MKNIINQSLKPLIFLGILSALGLQAQNKTQYPNGDPKHQQVTWADFSGKVDAKSPYAAVTEWSVFYEYDAPKFKKNEAVVEVRVRYEVDAKSWVIPEMANDELLKHEQGHVNTAYLLALELNQIYRQTKFTKRNYEAKIDAIYNNTYNKYVKMDERYDNETNHMFNTDAQEKWDVFYASEIKRLEAQVIAPRKK